MARELRECGISLEGRDTKLQPQGRLSLRLTQPAGRGMPGIGGGGGGKQQNPACVVVRDVRAGPRAEATAQQ